MSIGERIGRFINFHCLDEVDKDESNEKENEGQDDDEMEHQADDDDDAEEQKDDEEESGDDEQEYEVLSFIKFHTKSNFTIQNYNGSHFTYNSTSKVGEVLRRRKTTIKGKKTWKYLVTWKGLKCFLTVLAFSHRFLGFRS